MSEKLRIPTTEGLNRAKERIRELVEKEPSDHLVKIINDTNRVIQDEEENGQVDENDRAARPDSESVDL